MGRYAGYDDKYSDDADQVWVADVLSLTRTETPSYWRFKGKCPRCKHDLDVVLEVPSQVPVDALRVEFETARRRTVRQLIACNCDEAHEGRKETDAGCGIYGDAEIDLGYE